MGNGEKILDTNHFAWRDDNGIRPSHVTYTGALVDVFNIISPHGLPNKVHVMLEIQSPDNCTQHTVYKRNRMLQNRRVYSFENIIRSAHVTCYILYEQRSLKY